MVSQGTRCLRAAAGAVALCLWQAAACAQGTSVAVSGIVDMYYAYDFNSPRAGAETSIAPALHHNEFNLNLATLLVRSSADRMRGRFALQMGTFVHATTDAEWGTLRNVMEASVGVRVVDSLWLDAGIFPSHLGLESPVSSDNWIYSQSMMTMFSPNCEAGVSLSLPVSPRLSARVLLVNGWQTIDEHNSAKAVGTLVIYAPGTDVQIGWGTLAGNEADDSAASSVRALNDLYVKTMLTETLGLSACLDVGAQREAGKWRMWHGWAGTVYWTFLQAWSLGGRAEYYRDARGIVAPTGPGSNFQAVGGSVELDYRPTPGILWRLENRWLTARDAIYPAPQGRRAQDGLTAISITAMF